MNEEVLISHGEVTAQGSRLALVYPANNEWYLISIYIEQKYEGLNQNTDAQVFCGGDHILDWLSLQTLYFLREAVIYILADFAR